MRCRGSEVLTQSRAHESSLTDLHIACEPSASRDSGTDASQASAASAAGSAARRGAAGTAHALEPLRRAEDELSPAVIRLVKTLRAFYKVYAVCCFWSFAGVW